MYLIICILYIDAVYVEGAILSTKVSPIFDVSGTDKLVVVKLPVRQELGPRHQPSTKDH
jgi:hypothetical protein